MTNKKEEKRALMLFPHHLFDLKGERMQRALADVQNILLTEDSLFFGDKKYYLKFHKMKLLFHRASMKAYFNRLQDYLEHMSDDLGEAPQINYIDYQPLEQQDEEYGSLKSIFKNLKKKGASEIVIFEPNDWVLEKRVDELGNDMKIRISKKASPCFINSITELSKYFSGKTKFNQTSFYIKQRKKLNILLEKGKAKGGKWTYDTKNRKKIPRNLEIPEIPNIRGKNNENEEYIREATQYVQKRFADNYGNTKNFFYPITHKEANKWFNIFLKERFRKFGPYEDAMKKGENLLFHSLISPLLNTGLLLPMEAADRLLIYSEKNNIPINSTEGFIRQIIGWREFLNGIYHQIGVKERNSNYFEHVYKIPDSFYSGDTGILPIDLVIKKLLNTGYLHHIERLMLLGNFMNLCEIHPQEIYAWFMELFIDAYDWVMVPNVYGMSTYADGGLITTKPYVSSSNYVKKMSNYPKGQWCEIWDGLYWRFIHKHREKFKKNPRMRLMISILNKKKQKDIKKHIQRAEEFLESLHGDEYLRGHKPPI